MSVCWNEKVINNSSSHHYSHKLASFRCYIHRLINTPLSYPDYITELNFIKQIEANNGYNATLIDKMKQKLLNQAHKLA